LISWVTFSTFISHLKSPPDYYFCMFVTSFKYSNLGGDFKSFYSLSVNLGLFKSLNVKFKYIAALLLLGRELQHPHGLLRFGKKKKMANLRSG